MNRKFYQNRELSFEDCICLFQDAWHQSDDKWFDELDCSKSFTRRKIDISFDEFIKRLKASDFVQWRYIKDEDIITKEEMFEVFVRFDEWLNEPKDDHILRKHRDLFGWVRIPFAEAFPLIADYDLKEIV